MGLAGRAHAAAQDALAQDGPHVYGWILPRIVVASRPAATFGDRNLQAPTSAFPELNAIDPASSGIRSTWSLAQTRLGLNWH